MNLKEKIVITGLGVVSPIGIGLDAFWDSLINGRSGVCERPEFAGTNYPFKIGGVVKDFEGKAFVKPRKALKVMCRPIQFGFAAATMAAQQAGLAECGIDPVRVGTVFGAETFFAEPGEVSDVFHSCISDGIYDHDKWGEKFVREIRPLWMLKYLPNMVASHISIALNATGPSNTICQSDASSSLAIIEGATLIQRGLVDVAIVGGTGSPMSITGLLFHGHKHLSQQTQDPEAACRPFDGNRDGQVASEGAGAIVLESEAHAKARGAKILCEVAGWKRSYCTRPKVSEFGDSIAANIQDSLDKAGISANEVGLASLNGNGEVESDAAEAAAIKKIFKNISGFATKSNIGNIGPGSGAIEIASAILSLQNSLAPPSINYDSNNAGSLGFLSNQKYSLDSPFALKTSFSKTGQVASFILKC